MIFDRNRTLLVVIFAVTLFLALWQTAKLTRAAAMEELSQAGSKRLALFISNLTSELEKYESLPRILARDERIVRLLRNPLDVRNIAIVNKYLADVNRIAGASDTYVIDKSGLTLVASNWNLPNPFVGENFGFRPYFQAALRGEKGRYFALGTTSKRRGYYYAAPVEENDEVLGVAVVKVSPEGVELAWQDARERTLVTDYNGIVFISNNPAWLFKALHPLSDEALREIKSSRQYSDAPISPMPVDRDFQDGHGRQFLTLKESRDGGQALQITYLTQSRKMPDHKWLVHMLTDAKVVETRVNYAVASAFILGLAFFLVLLYLAQRRRNLIQRLQHQKDIEETLVDAQKQLEQQVRKRTLELTETNQHLDRKIREHEKTEHDLRKTQEELLQSAKLAVIGQMSAGITHELNQPLTAIQTYVGTAQHLLLNHHYEELNDNLTNVLMLVNRMARLTRELKTFSRKSTLNVDKVALHKTIDQAMTLITHAHKAKFEFVKAFSEAEVFVHADALRLEQVFINVFNNALDAMKDCADRVLHVSTDMAGDSVTVHIRDSGPGIAEENLGKLFDPFFTSKEPGAGLGLGLSITEEIVSGFGGSIRAANHVEGGAVFTIVLPTANADGAGTPTKVIGAAYARS